ncbi:MAG: hypothetical protein Q9170_000285 [Blastenia crenularia]
MSRLWNPWTSYYFHGQTDYAVALKEDLPDKVKERGQDRGVGAPIKRRQLDDIPVEDLSTTFVMVLASTLVKVNKHPCPRSGKHKNSRALLLITPKSTMLGWLTGNSQRASLQPPEDVNGKSSYMEEPPETPAPVFAVRAFKTALFGTPHPNQHEENAIEEKPSLEKLSKPKHSPRAQFTTPKVGSKSYISRAKKVTPSVSPAKGILLTPGTAATRRKTVSFGNLESYNGAKVQKSDQVTQPAISTPEKVSDTVSPEQAEANLQSQPTLTKELFETQLDKSKQRLGEDQRAAEVNVEETLPLVNGTSEETLPAQSIGVDTTIDITVDLTKPRSQSGQHWKAEYERYQRNSNRELKNIIQHGQNVKSYAEKKDIEATTLQEKLKLELAKCAAMETKVSKLAIQLANGRRYGSDGSAEQAKLMNDISRQTASAVRYKQKADKYRIAIKQQESSSVVSMDEYGWNSAEDLAADAIASRNNMPGSAELRDAFELNAQRVELDTLSSKLDVAEQKVAKLEAVNAKLVKNLNRVKNEMTNYDGRRLRFETKYKQREANLMAEKRACEAKLKQITKEHEDLLRNIQGNLRVDRNYEASISTKPRRDNLSRSKSSLLPHTATQPNPGNTPDQAQVHKLAHPRLGAQILHDQIKLASRDPSIDIWTMGTPNDTGEMTPPAADPAINLSHVALSEATHNALRVIDNNAVSEFLPEPSSPPDKSRPTLEHLARMDSALQPDFPSSDPYESSAVRRVNNRRNTIASPRPSMVNLASSGFKGEDTPRLRRNTSLAGSRRSTLNGGRGKVGELPPDRVAAARARLAHKKSMKENGRR